MAKRQVERRRIELLVAVVRSGVPGYLIAKSAPMHPSRFSAIANGRIDPTPDERRRIAAALDVEADVLFADTGSLVGSQ